MTTKDNCFQYFTREGIPERLELLMKHIIDYNTKASNQMIRCFYFVG